MSFDPQTDEMTSEPSLMDIFGPDASEEVITRDKEAAMLSMADIAAVMNAGDEPSHSAEDKGLVTTMAKFGVETLLADDRDEIPDSPLLAGWPVIDLNLIPGKANRFRPTSLHKLSEGVIKPRPSREAVDALRKRFAHVGYNLMVRTLSSSSEPEKNTAAVRSDAVGQGGDEEVNSHVERLRQELEELFSQQVDLSDVTLSLSYINPLTQRVVTKVLAEHEEPHTFSPLAGTVRGASSRVFTRPGKVKK